MSKKVLIIGAGASGLTAIKCCLDEDIVAVCYERSHDIGGLWRYEESEKNGASVYKSTTINTSKEMMGFSDFPIPKEFPNYMHHTLVMEYFRMYCTKFKLDKHITFHTEVVSCEFADDYLQTGRWNVKSKNTETFKVTTETFDGVITAVGHHAEPNLPFNKFQGLCNFEGQYLHSISYRHEKGYEDKNILVVGAGNSGGDISVELSRVSRKVFLSTRRGTWVVRRMGDHGFPNDMLLNTRFRKWRSALLPVSYLSYVTEAMLNKQFDHQIYGLRPNHGKFAEQSMTNDELPNCILNGSLTIKGNIKQFTKTGVIFEDGAFEEIDIVIFATGYNFSFPFLDRSLIEPESRHLKLYKLMWPPSLEMGTLASVGGIQPHGATVPISEMQCRWVTRVFKGLSKLPSRQAMERDIAVREQKRRWRYNDSPRFTVQVDFISYMDEIAQEIGVRPNVFLILLKDPMLAYKVFFEGCSSYQYRLTGPGKWNKARETIMTQRERILCPFQAGRKAVVAKRGAGASNIYLGFLLHLRFLMHLAFGSR